MSKEYDPKMHSAEHILNQVMVRKFDCGRCFSAHINKKKSKCDYHFPRELKTDEVRQIEKDVNEQISKDMPVLIEQMSIEDAKELFNIERVPDKDTLDSLRVVRMGDFDACPCIGPHVASTALIGQFKITTTGFDDGVLRIRFKLVS